MQIRPFKIDDYEHVLALLLKSGVEPPSEPSDFDGICLIAEENESIIGCIWALTGLSTKAYIDYFAVDSEFQKTHVGWILLQSMDAILKSRGIKRYMFHVEQNNIEFKELIDKYGEANNVRRLRDLLIYKRELI